MILVHSRSGAQTVFPQAGSWLHGSLHPSPTSAGKSLCDRPPLAEARPESGGSSFGGGGGLRDGDSHSHSYFEEARGLRPFSFGGGGRGAADCSYANLFSRRYSIARVDVARRSTAWARARGFCACAHGCCLGKPAALGAPWVCGAAAAAASRYRMNATYDIRYTICYVRYTVSNEWGGYYIRLERRRRGPVDRRVPVIGLGPWGRRMNGRRMKSGRARLGAICGVDDSDSPRARK